MADLILFPSDYYNVRCVDADFKEEYAAAAAAEVWNIALFGYDQWLNEGKLVLTGVPAGKHQTVYRGWMMKPEQYRRFYTQLLQNGIQLITSPEEYETMHIFPNVYRYFGSDTARMKIYPLHAKIDIEDVKQSFRRFMVKDFVKSVKGTESPRFFDQSVTQEEFDDWMKVFYQYRGYLLTGGICIKEFLDLKQYDHKTNEYRVFYMNHIPAAISRNSGQNILTPFPPEKLIEKYRNLPSPYYTVDFAQLSDDSWRIIEAGDGGVSGLPEGQDPYEYYRKLFQCFR